jgi:Rad3-related DNA helicase
MNPNVTFVAEVDRCFKGGGPFISGLKTTKPSAEERPSQAVFATSLSNFLVSNSADYNHSTPDKQRPVLFSGDIATGMGKTLVYSVVAALKRRIVGSRTIIGTFTRQLREEIVREAPTINAVMQTMGYDPVKIMPYVALSSACSLSHATTLATQHPVFGLQYLEFVKSCYAQHKLPLVADFLTTGDLDFLYRDEHGKPSDTPLDSLDLLTVRYNELDRIRSSIATKAKNKTPYDDVEQTFVNQREANREAKNSADILVVTHALLTHNAIQFGTILNTNKKDYNNSLATLDRFDVIIDEADLYHEQALNFFDLDISMDDLGKFIGLTKAFKQLKSFLIARTKLRYNFDSQHEQAMLMDLIRKTLPNAMVTTPTVLDAVDTKIAKSEDTSIDIDYLTKLKMQLQKIVDWSDQRGNARGASTPSDAGVSLMSYVRNGSISLMLQAEKGSKVANRMWRNVDVHAIDHIAFISGTLTGCDRKNVDGFYRLAGIYANDDKTVDVIWGPKGNRVMQMPNGSLRRSNLPSIRIPLEDRSVSQIVFTNWSEQPYDQQTKLLNPLHWDKVGEVLTGFYDGSAPDKTTLVLLTSYRTQEYLEQYFRERQIQNVIFQSAAGAGATVQKAREYYARGEKCIIFGLNWSGVNYVSEDGKTMIERTIFPTIPNPVMRAMDDFYRANYRDHASRRFRQGMGRSMRNNGDRPEFWFLDSRLAVPEMLNDGSCSNRDQELANSLFEECLLKSQPKVGLMTAPHDIKWLDVVDRG